MIRAVLGGALWVFTVSVGAWAYVEGKRIDNAQRDGKCQEEAEEPKSLPIGGVPWSQVSTPYDVVKFD